MTKSRTRGGDGYAASLRLNKVVSSEPQSTPSFHYLFSALDLVFTLGVRNKSMNLANIRRIFEWMHNVSPWELGDEDIVALLVLLDLALAQKRVLLEEMVTLEDRKSKTYRKRKFKITYLSTVIDGILLFLSPMGRTLVMRRAHQIGLSLRLYKNESKSTNFLDRLISYGAP